MPMRDRGIDLIAYLDLAADLHCVLRIAGNKKAPEPTQSLLRDALLHELKTAGNPG